MPWLIDHPTEGAVERSRALLEHWLTPEQLAQLNDESKHLASFDVIGGDTGTRYRITEEINYNIHVLVGDGCPCGECVSQWRTIDRYCVVPEIVVPVWDKLLCQKMGLEKDETATMAVAVLQPRWTSWAYD